VSISKDSNAPIHKQLEKMIMEKIRKGILKPGDRVSSEFGIANKYGISRSTVRNVFDRLVTKNVLLRRAGKGTFVAFPVTTENISLLVGFSVCCFPSYNREYKFISRFFRKDERN
jgi:DNA-binding GntR family transcriptional regulator